MAHGQAFALDQRQYFLRQSQQPLEIGDMASRFVDQLRDFTLSHVLLLSQTVIGPRLLDRVQIFALNILDQCKSHHFKIIEIANNRRDLMQLRLLRGTPAAFARDQLVPAIRNRTNDDRLNYPSLRNRCSQII